MPVVPTFEDPFLEGMAFGLRKRTKAISHKVRTLGCDKVYDLRDGERRERLELRIEDIDQIEFRMHAWPDRWIWLDARRSAKSGWLWEWTDAGRLTGQIQALVPAIEDTLAQLIRMEPAQVSSLTSIWKPLLAKGPVDVR